MDSKTIREKFLRFFEECDHVIVRSSSLIPDDPSVLLTTAGMQQFKPYFVGKADPIKDFGSKNTVSIQKCFRTSDIDEVGDESHLTFFEMLGNFSFGGYFKKEAIQYGYEFITSSEWMNLKIDYVSVFGGDGEVPEDGESGEIWKSLGVTNIRKAGREDNFWGPTGNEGPCGPTTEIYVKNSAGQSIEVWNIVFNEYYKHPDGRLERIKTPGVDTGMGLERLVMVSQNVPTIFETDLFKVAFKRNFGGQSGRIVLDHLRGAMFLIADGVQPSNKGTDYILRRLMRRAIFHVRKLSGEDESGGTNAGISEIIMLLNSGILFYGDVYTKLKVNKGLIIETFRNEYDQFVKTLDIGSRELSRILGGPNKIGGKLSARDAFNIYQSYGLPWEVIKDLCQERGAEFDDGNFDKEFAKHQEISRAGAEKKFGGHGLILDTGELKAGNEEELKKVLRLHTATHLLQQALRDVLGPEVRQMGSDITPLRTRFDFAFPRKLTPEEIKKTEDIVNEKIKEDLPMQCVELPKAEAEKSGALYYFKEKYPEKVKVYYVGKDMASAWSKEFCGGPHIKRTSEIGGFRIAKEEAVGAGTRRIRGVVEQ